MTSRSTNLNQSQPSHPLPKKKSEQKLTPKEHELAGKHAKKPSAAVYLEPDGQKNT